MVAGAVRVIINTAIKTLLLMLFELVGWVHLNPTTERHDTGRNWVVAAIIGLIFAIATMAVLELLFRYMVRTHGLSLLLLPFAGMVVLLILLVAVPHFIGMSSLLLFCAVGVGLSLSLPIASRRDKQLVVISGGQPPTE